MSKSRRRDSHVAPYDLYDQGHAAAWQRKAIREELLAASRMAIRTVVHMPVPDISERMEITMADADALRRAARKWVVEQWSFEDSVREKG